MSDLTSRTLSSEVNTSNTDTKIMFSPLLYIYFIDLVLLQISVGGKMNVQTFTGTHTCFSWLIKQLTLTEVILLSPSHVILELNMNDFLKSG